MRLPLPRASAPQVRACAVPPGPLARAAALAVMRRAPLTNPAQQSRSYVRFGKTGGQASMCLPILGLVFGISGGEFFVILLVIVVIVGPQRLPEYTRTLTQWVRKLRVFLDNTKQQIAEEVGPELGDLSLRDLDPRQYDPRKIVRDALGEDLDAIRRDFANPIQSVIDAGKDASTAAAATIAKDTTAADSRSLSEMIEDKANEKVEANAADAAAEPAPADIDTQASDDAADAVTETAKPEATTDGHEEAAAIAPTLVESDAPAATPISSRPLSPREVLKAAKAAARNRQDIDAPLPA